MARGGFNMGGMNRNQMMAQARKMQEQLLEAQQKASLMQATASAGGGAVKVTASGDLRLTNITIDPEAIDPEDIEMLQDMILAATNDGRALQRLLDELGRLPGIGPKSAQRIAYHLLEVDSEEARRLAQAILELKQQVHFCPTCFNYATRDECDICLDSSRDRSKICVVSEPKDVSAIERTGAFHGLYHVLGGVISPMDKIGPEQLHVRELLSRLADGTVTEVVLATNPDVEGETTATYLSRTINPLGMTVTRLASGLPVGGDLEYADEVTLGRAIEARREV